jgi:hypothetical protein
MARNSTCDQTIYVRGARLEIIRSLKHHEMQWKVHRGMRRNLLGVERDGKKSLSVRVDLFGNFQARLPPHHGDRSLHW